MKITSFVSMRLANYISDLLYRYDCVIVPNFGGFVTNKVSAVLDEETSMFHPPKKQVTFNAYLQHNDGLLANYIASAERISFEKATEQIHEQVALWKTEVKTGTVTIGKVGTVTLNDAEQLVFEPNLETNFLLEAYGLAATPGQQVEREETPVIPVNTVEESPVSTKSKLIPLVKRATVAAAIVGVGITGWYAYTQQEQAAAVADQEATLKKKIQTATFISEAPLPSIDLEVNKEALKNFHVVAGAFQSLKNADKKLEELQEMGYNAKIIGENEWGLTQVVFGSYQTQEEAREALMRIKATITKDAWLLHKQ